MQRPEDKNIHNRFTPRAAPPSPAFTFRRPISSNRVVSTNNEPIPFSRPYIQSADTFTVKNKYSGNRRREFCLQSAISLPAIEETPDETWLTSPPPTPRDRWCTAPECVDYHDRSEDFDLQKLERAQEIAASATDIKQPYVFHDCAQSPTDIFESMTPRHAACFPADEDITGPAKDLLMPSRPLRSPPDLQVMMNLVSSPG